MGETQKIGDMTKRAVIYKGDFAYNLGNVFAAAVAEGLQDAGYGITWLDLCKPEECKIARDRSIYQDHDLIFGVNAIRPCIDKDDFRYYRDTGCVFVGMLIDPPLLQYPRLFFNNDILTCIDRSHIRFLNQYLAGKINSQICHLPHGGCFSPRPPSRSPRRFDLVFAGTFFDPNEAYRKIMEFPRGLKQIFTEAIDLLLTTENLTVFDALAQVTLSYGFDVSTDRDTFNLLVVNYKHLDNFIRAEKRLQTITALDQAGIKLNIWGKNWPENRFHNHTIYPPRDLDEINYLMTRSKVVLDFGFYEDGSHERVFTAMLNGAVSVAIDNPYHRENFTDGEDICLYQFTRPDKLAESLRDLLRDEDRMQSIAAAGQRNAVAKHSWKSRAKTIIEYVEQYRKQNPR